MATPQAVSTNLPVASGSPQFANLIENARASRRRDIDGAIAAVRANKDSWVKLRIRERIDPLTVASKRPAEFGRQLAAFEANPSLGKFPGLIWTALRS